MFAALKKFVGTQEMPKIDVEMTQFTPDIWKLEEYFFQSVFVYDQHMRGCSGFHDMMEGQVRKLGAAFTKDDNYVLWQKNLGQYSQVFALPMSEQHNMGRTTLFGLPAKVLGHVYAMRPEQIAKLDNHLENGVQFIRKRIKVEIPFSYREARIIRGQKYQAGEAIVHTIPAWAYIGNLPYWSEQIDPGHRRFSPVNKYTEGVSGTPYYYYAEKLERKIR